MPEALSYYTPVDSLLNFNEECAVIKSDLINESMLVTGALSVGLSALPLLIGIDNIAKFLSSVIESIIAIIKLLLEELKKIWKWLTIHANDAYASNNTFLYRYGAKLDRISNVEVIMEGYDMTTDIMRIVNNLSVEAKTSNNDIGYINSILLGNPKFKTRDDVLLQVNKNRAEILDIDIIGSSGSMERYVKGLDNFDQVLIDKIYGYKHNITYKVADAINIIKNYDQRISTLTATSKVIDEQSNKEIKYLSLMKDRLISSKFVIKNARKDMVDQFNLLVEYKQRTLNDFLMAFRCISQYINDINTQAKVICIKALQEN